MSVVSLSSSASTLEFLQKVGFSFPWLAISTSAMKVELTGRWSDNRDSICLYSNCLRPFPYHSIRSHLQRTERHMKVRTEQKDPLTQMSRLQFFESWILLHACCSLLLLHDQMCFPRMTFVWMYPIIVIVAGHRSRLKSSWVLVGAATPPIRKETMHLHPARKHQKCSTTQLPLPLLLWPDV